MLLDPSLRTKMLIHQLAAVLLPKLLLAGFVLSLKQPEISSFISNAGPSGIPETTPASKPTVGLAQTSVRPHFGLPSPSFNIMLIQAYAPTSNAEEAEVEWLYEDLQDLSELTLKKDVLFIIGDWNAKVGSQETPGVTGKFGLGVENEAGQRLIEFCQENALVIANTLFQQHKRRLHMDITKWSIQIRLIIFFAAKDGEALYS